MRAQRITEALYQDAIRLQIDNLYTACSGTLTAPPRDPRELS